MSADTCTVEVLCIGESVTETRTTHYEPSPELLADLAMLESLAESEQRQPPNGRAA